jgi:hypothetical protein
MTLEIITSNEMSDSERQISHAFFSHVEYRYCFRKGKKVERKRFRKGKETDVKEGG